MPQLQNNNRTPVKPNDVLTAEEIEHYKQMAIAKKDKLEKARI